MAIIEARQKQPTKAVTVRLSERTLALVDEYARQLGEERGYVVEQLVLFALRQDRQFAEQHGLAARRRARRAAVTG